MLYADLCFSLRELTLLRSISSDISVGCVCAFIAWNTCGLESDDDPRSEGNCSLNASSRNVTLLNFEFLSVNLNFLGH